VPLRDTHLAEPFAIQLPVSTEIAVRFLILMLLAGLLAPASAMAQTAPTAPSQAPKQQPAPSAAATKAEPEEPDFAFVSGGPFTQLKNSFQFIHQTGYGTRRFAVPAGRLSEDQFHFFLRTEYGITDRWELDIITPGAGSRTGLNGVTTGSDYAFADSILGVRYRLLKEDTAPITLTMGPQVILPTGSVRRGTGSGSGGFAWDVAAAKDWGGPVFVFSSLNYNVLPSADDTTPGSSANFALQGLTFASALGIRTLERPSRSGGNHDVHVFLEAAGDWAQQVAPGFTTGTREGELSWVFSPGVRYGYITPKKTLVEIGITFPIGLGPNGPKKGFVIQFQFERLLGEQ